MGMNGLLLFLQMLLYFFKCFSFEGKGDSHIVAYTPFQYLSLSPTFFVLTTSSLIIIRLFLCLMESLSCDLGVSHAQIREFFF